MPWKEASEVRQRLELVRAMMRGERSVSALCREAGVSRQTGYKYLKRYDQQGRAGLVDKPRVNQWVGRYSGLKRRVFTLRRRHPTWGARKIGTLLAELYPRKRLPSERTVESWLSKAGLARRVRHKRAGAGLVPKPIRPTRCNQVWSADFKGWFRTTDGRRVEPLTVRDVYSKYILTVQPIASLSEANVRRAFARLFRKYGRPKVILCDRGSPFCGSGPHGLTRLSLWWYRLGIRPQFVNRRDRIDNNAHEQMHGVMQKEVAAVPALTFAAQVQRLEAWRDEYNHLRPHEALQMRRPASLYRPKPRPLPQTLEPSYCTGTLVRTVRPQGDICLARKRVIIGRAFARLRVGLQPTAQGPYQVSFGQLPLGTLLPGATTLLHLPVPGREGADAPSLKPSPQLNVSTIPIQNCQR